MARQLYPWSRRHNVVGPTLFGNVVFVFRRYEEICPSRVVANAYPAAGEERVRGRTSAGMKEAMSVGSSAGSQAVSDAGFRNDEARTRRIGFEFPAQVADVYP